MSEVYCTSDKRSRRSDLSRSAVARKTWKGLRDGASALQKMLIVDTTYYYNSCDCQRFKISFKSACESRAGEYSGTRLDWNLKLTWNLFFIRNKLPFESRKQLDKFGPDYPGSTVPSSSRTGVPSGNKKICKIEIRSKNKNKIAATTVLVFLLLFLKSRLF